MRMTNRFLPLAILLCAPVLLHAQAKPTCALRPTSLIQMRHCYRPLLVFSPSASDQRLIRQQSLLDEAADDMMDRFVLFLPVAPQSANYKPPLDTPYTLLNQNELTVLLLGEDGSIKFRSTVPVIISRLNSLIDAMPDRKVEIARPHAN